MTNDAPLFADVLMYAMLGDPNDAAITKSELARRVWGEAKPPSRGARNRDRIGHYLRGTSYPDPANLQKIATALGVPVAELASARRPLSRRHAMHSNGPSREQAPETPITLTGRFTITLTGLGSQ